MQLAIILSRAVSGIDAPQVTVEVHISYGVVGFQIVGLPETAVKESRDRVRSALLNSHFEFPIRRITVNLAPADLPKEGGRFDLAIAIGILAASEQIPTEALGQYEFTGELALSGELRPVKGLLPTALAAHKAGRTLILPEDNAGEAGLVKQAHTLTAKHLLAVCEHFHGKKRLPTTARRALPLKAKQAIDLCDVQGHQHAKRALEIAAAGEHSLLLMGPPGTGKTMLANRLVTILPELSEEEALEVAALASLSQKGFELQEWRKIPFRAPHHSASYAALVGGGRPPRPGEVSLAHKGVLFLDELPEFKRAVLECLREPLESGEVTISRAAWQSVFPAQFQLIAAMNPCPCGYAGSKLHECVCSAEQVKRYRQKLSGPFMDRIDMQVAVDQVPQAVLLAAQTSLETSEQVRKRVVAAREAQLRRQGVPNARLSVSALTKMAQLDEATQEKLLQIIEKFKFSSRGTHRLLKLARTIADLATAERVELKDLAQALHFRGTDKANYQ